MACDIVVLHCAAEHDLPNDEEITYINPLQYGNQKEAGPTHTAIWKKHSVKTNTYETHKMAGDTVFFVNFVQLLKLKNLDDDFSYQLIKNQIIHNCATARKVMIIVHGRAGDGEFSWTYKASHSKEVSSGQALHNKAQFLRYDDMATQLSDVLSQKSHLISLIMCYGARSELAYGENHEKLDDPDFIKDSYAYRFFENFCKRNKNNTYILTARTGITSINVLYKNTDVGVMKVMPEADAIIRAQLEVEEREIVVEYSSKYDEMNAEKGFSQADRGIAQIELSRAKGEKAPEWKDVLPELKKALPNLKDPTINRIYRYHSVTQAAAKKPDPKTFQPKVGKFVYVHKARTGDIAVYRRYVDGKLAKDKKGRLDKYLDGNNLDEIGEVVMTIPMS
ncbi:hypothetical protein V5G24_09620 [Xanthobacter sp. VTT E-85241]|uniref:hypothetical protein n=1 Tax=Roseixanthobacter finlandensis TaxID=3119922 RepID=UPI00372AD6B2